MQISRVQREVGFKDKRGGDSKPAPLITSVVISGLTTLTVTWTTDVASTSQVRYGIYPFAGDFVSAFDGTLVTSHSVSFAILDSTKTYRISVLSKRAEGAQGESNPVAYLPSFDPMGIADLRFWFKADKEVYQNGALTIPSVANNDPVQGWKDQSGNGYHYTANYGGGPTLVTNSQNGLPGLKCLNASQQGLNCPSGTQLTNPCTFICVAQPIANTELIGAFVGSFTSEGGSRPGFLLHQSSGDVSGFVRWVGGVANPVGYPPGTTHVVVMTMDSNTEPTQYIKLYRGAWAAFGFDVIGPGANLRMDGITLGVDLQQTAPNGRINAIFYEMLYYQHVLTQEDQKNVLQYLGVKWNLPVSDVGP